MNVASLSLVPRKLGGKVTTPPSKSMALRLLACAAFADAPTVLECPDPGDDVAAMIACLEALGAGISTDKDTITVTPIEKPNHGAVLPCGQSGATLRFLLPMAAAIGAPSSIVMEGRLPARPVTPLWQELSRHGITLSEEGCNPFEISGTLMPDTYTVPADISSQFASGFALALPLIGKYTNVGTATDEEPVSRLIVPLPVCSGGYIRMTLAALAAFGVRAEEQPFEEGGLCYDIPAGQAFHSPGRITVEGDYSSAAFWLCAGALGTNRLQVDNLPSKTEQGDRAILDILRAYGATVTMGEDKVFIRGGNRRALRVDAAQIPDLIPPLSLLAAVADGESVFTGIGRLRLKESDRVDAIVDMITCLGGHAEAGADTLRVVGTPSLRGGKVNCHGDHRIAMTAAIASLVCEAPVTLTDALCVAKSYPKFFDDLSSLTLSERNALS